MLKRVDEHWRTEVKPAFRRHRWFIGPAERRRLKDHLARKREERAHRRRAAARARRATTVR